jgi:hypothetical protein
MHRIILDKDFENDKKGKLITVTSTKLKRIKEAGIKYMVRLKSNTGYVTTQYPIEEKKTKKEK